MDIQLLKETSAKIFIDERLVGSGTFYKNRNNVYVITAAHVIYGKGYKRRPLVNTIKVENSKGNNYTICQVLTLPSYEQHDIDFALLKTDMEISECTELIINEPTLANQASFCFRGYPNVKNGKGQNFLNCTFSDSNKQKFELQGKIEDFIQLIEGSEKNFNGISGSGVFQFENGYHYLVGVNLGFVIEEGEFCTYECININLIKQFTDLRQTEIIHRKDKLRVDLKKHFKNEYVKKTSPLIATRLSEDKSYYPPLFEPHPELEKTFQNYLKSKSKAFSIIAPSGMGKTCWMCYKAKELTDNGNFVSFFQFGKVRNGILESIVDDLKRNTVFSYINTVQEGLEAIKEIINNDILYVFLDGLDERSHVSKKLIIEEFFHNVEINCKIIVSCKSMYWQNFEYTDGTPSQLYTNLYTVIDGGGNENKAFLLNEISNDQFKKIITKYKIHYSYKKIIPQDLLNEFKRNTFLLHIAFSILLEDNNAVLDASSKSLISKYLNVIKSKYEIKPEDLQKLYSIAQIIFKKNTDRITYDDIYNEIGEIPKSLYKSNIIIETEINDFDTEIEFYYSKLRDYIISLKILEFDSKTEDYFVEYKKDLSNVRHEVLNTYFAITDTETRKKIEPLPYNKALEFHKNRIEIIESNFSAFKGALQPFTTGSSGIVTNVDLQTDRCTSYSYTANEQGTDPVIMFPSSSADHYTIIDNKHDINTMYHCYDLKSDFHNDNLKSEIEDLIKKNKNRLYKHSFNISNNPLMLKERILLLTLKRYKQYFNIDRNEYRPCENYLPLTLNEIENAIYERCQIHEFAKKHEESIFPNSAYADHFIDTLIQRNMHNSMFEKYDLKFVAKKLENSNIPDELLKYLTEQDTILLRYIDQLTNLGINEIAQPFIPDWGKTSFPRSFSFKNFKNETLPNIYQTLYFDFLEEYRIFIETNFPKIMHYFPFYKISSCKFVLILHNETNKVTSIAAEGKYPTVICRYEDMPHDQNKWLERIANLKEKYYIGKVVNNPIEYHIDGLFKIRSNSGGFNVPDNFDILNRTILHKLKKDLKSFYDKVEKEKIDSFFLTLES